MALTLNGTTGIVTPGVTDTGDLSVAGTTALTTPLPVTSGGTGATSLSGITVGTATNATNATNATTATNLASGSAGTVPYQSASGTTAMLAAGTSGQVLTSSGAGAPTWTTPSAGAMTLLATVTASSSATLSFNSTYITSTYETYVIECINVYPATNNVSFLMGFSTDNGSSFLTCWTGGFATSPSWSTGFGGTTGAGGVYLDSYSVYGGNQLYITSAGGISGSYTLYKPSSMSINAVTGQCAFGGNLYSGNVAAFMSGGPTAAGYAVNYLKFYMSSGNIASGTIRLYGIAKT